VYTHEIQRTDAEGRIKVGQKCFRACWWPIGDDTQAASAAAQEKQWPMMMLESGQVTRVNVDNLVKIREQ